MTRFCEAQHPIAPIAPQMLAYVMPILRPKRSMTQIPMTMAITPPACLDQSLRSDGEHEIYLIDTREGTDPTFGILHELAVSINKMHVYQKGRLRQSGPNDCSGVSESQNRDRYEHTNQESPPCELAFTGEAWSHSLRFQRSGSE
jgi:hypothetical protein